MKDTPPFCILVQLHSAAYQSRPPRTSHADLQPALCRPLLSHSWQIAIALLYTPKATGHYGQVRRPWAQCARGRTTTENWRRFPAQYPQVPPPPRSMTGGWHYPALFADDDISTMGLVVCYMLYVAQQLAMCACTRRTWELQVPARVTMKAPRAMHDTSTPNTTTGGVGLHVDADGGRRRGKRRATSCTPCP